MPKTAVVPLTFRQLSKEDSHFLVKYHEDGELQVRSRGFVLTQAKIKVGSSYRVQYGLTSKEVSSASILASGTESRMREEQGKRDKRPKKRQTPINKQPSVTSQPSVKRQKKQPDESTKENRPQSLKVQRKSVHKRARVVDVCPAPVAVHSTINQSQHLNVETLTPPTIPVLQTPAASTPQTLATPNADIATSQRQVTSTSQALATTTSQTLPTSTSQLTLATTTSQTPATTTSQTLATPTLQTLASPTADTATSQTTDFDESTLPSALQPLPPFQPVSASTPSAEIDAPLSREDLADSVLRRSPRHTPNRPPLAPSRPRQDSSSPNVESRRPTVSTRTTTTPPNSTAVAPNANRTNRTPFRPARPPSQNPSLQQLQYSVNVCIEQQKDCKKATDEIKSAQTATNRRMTAIENTAQRIENKLDQVLVLLCQQRTHAEPRDNEPSTVERLGVDADAEEITLDTEFLQLSYRKANNCGHFAAIIVPKVFPELFGPMRLRLQYNWEGNKGKQALDEQRKNVLKKMVNQYYPETRVESSWVSCVSRINEVLRRKYIPRAQQLQEIHHVEHTEATDDGENISNELPSYADQMMHQSLDDIATPNFSSTIGPYMQYMNMDVY